MSNQYNYYPLAHVVCHDGNKVIGNGNNDMPWVCKEDMNYFRQVTLNRVVVMGYNTYMSIPVAVRSDNAPVLNNRIAVVIADPNRLDYEPVGRVDIDRLINYRITSGTTKQKGFTLFVPSLSLAIDLIKIIHAALAGCEQDVSNWILPADAVKAYIVGGGKLYAESLQHAYIKEIHKTELPVYYCPPSNIGRDTLTYYPDFDESLYRTPVITAHPCKVTMNNGKVKTGKMKISIYKKRVGITDLN